jgi:DNA-binding transcriptional ArsR family regulator
MGTIPNLEELGRLVGDASRAGMLGALMDGRAWTGRELAACAHVTPSTASAHLGRLVNGGLLTVISQGRNRYYRIGSADVAHALESLMVLAPVTQPRHPTQRKIADDLAAARLCYDHLAGKLGVAIADSLVARRAVLLSEASSTLTPQGAELFERLGFSFDGVQNRRPLCRACLDWSERRPHVAGAVGAALARMALEKKWVHRKRGSRALTVTARGHEALREALQIDCSDIRTEE